MSDREQSCEERVQSHLDSRAEDVRKMLAAASGGTLCRNCGQVIEHEDDVWTHVDTVATWCDGRRGEVSDAFAEPDEDYTEDSLYDFGLSVERKVTLKFLMSTGGPADWLEITCDHEDANGTQYLTVERVTYHFSDWFDHAERAVDEGTPLYELAEWVAENQGDA